MTPGEQMVYAAAFARELERLDSAPLEYCRPGAEEALAEWKMKIYAEAAAKAHNAVVALRAAHLPFCDARESLDEMRDR
jgi:hypothetical protein